MASMVTNITAAGRRRRYGIAGAALGTGLAAAALMLWRGVDAGWRIWLFVPFWLAGLGYFQGSSGT